MEGTLQIDIVEFMQCFRTRARGVSRYDAASASGSECIVCGRLAVEHGLGVSWPSATIYDLARLFSRLEYF